MQYNPTISCWEAILKGGNNFLQEKGREKHALETLMWSRDARD